MDPVRVNINVSRRVHDWYTQQAKEMGTSRSAVMAMALSQYMVQSSSLDTLAEIPKIVEKLDNLQVHLDK